MKNPPDGAGMRRCYLLTPRFIMRDALFGLNVRGSDLTSPELRYLYDGLCLLCALPATGRLAATPWSLA